MLKGKCSASGMRELIANRKGRFDYELLETHEAGIVLLGTEVKVLCQGQGNLGQSYVLIGEEALLKGFSIPLYKHGGMENHLEYRDRKLLLHKRELRSLRNESQKKGLTIIPLALLLRRKIKVVIGVGRGRKKQDKREVLKKREQLREQQRLISSSIKNG